jgi:hypothetical protein
MEDYIQRIASALESIAELMKAEDIRRRRRTLNEKRETKAATKRDIESKKHDTKMAIIAKAKEKSKSKK